MVARAALLRAVNVGGTGKLAMKDLRSICERLGFADPVTYIQSGNVVFDTDLDEGQIKKKLGAALERKIGKPVGVLVRSKKELTKTLSRNPFPDAEARFVLVLFLDEPPDPAVIKATLRPGGEELIAVGREVFMHFPNGMGKSKLKIPFRDIGTARNLNSTKKILELLENRD